MTGSASPPDDVRFARFRPEARAPRRRVVVAFDASVVLTAAAGSLPPAIPPLALFAPSAVLAWRRSEA